MICEVCGGAKVRAGQDCVTEECPNHPKAPEEKFYRIAGGTHLGIAGCYGEREFEAVSIKDLIEQIRANRRGSKNLDGTRGLEGCAVSMYQSGVRWVYQFTGAHDMVLFEFEILKEGAV